jgi:2-methylcitrate dehydratase PrpD
MWVTEILSEYIFRLQPRDIPQTALLSAKRCTLDLLGAALSGFETKSAASVRSLCKRLFAKGDSSVWFSGVRLQEAAAALANSAAASALDLDDGHRLAGGHPGASIIPAALATAEALGAGPEELLASIVIGYEIGIRIGAARDMSSLDTFSTGRWCSFGAAAACGFLRKAPPGVLAEALAIAGVKSPGLSAAGYSRVMGNSVKEGIPWSTFTGMAAVNLAGSGFTGPVDILDHPSYYDSEEIIRGLGRDFEIERVYFKPYSCCRWIHSALDAMLFILDEHGIAPEKVDKVTVETFERALRLNNYPNPDSLEAAQYSIPFSLAVAAVDGPSALLPITSECLGDPGIVSFAEKVELVADPELDKVFPAKAPARIVLRTGTKEYTKLVYDAKGDPANPMDQIELKAKFRRLSSGLMACGEQDEVIEAVENLEIYGTRRLLNILGRSNARYFHPQT